MSDFYVSGSYILVIIGALICTLASSRIKSSYNKYSKVHSRSGMTSEQVAEAILHSAGIYDVSIQRISGNLTDHYSPSEKVLRLSDSVYGSTSIAAIGVAAHECGHALQHDENYGPLALRSVAVPVSNIGSYLYWPVIIAGLILGWGGLCGIGILLFLFVVAFQVITLPVEFNASKRALAILEEKQYLVGDEMDGARKVLKAAAMTYVAAVLNSILQLVRLILISQNGKKRK